MKDSVSWLTPKQAGELAGYSARHIQNLISKGKISARKEEGKYLIDKAEFFRVFPEAHKKEKAGNIAQKDIDNARMEKENEMLKEIASQKDKEIAFLRSQIESFTQEKSQMLEAITHHARLLEHKETSHKRVSSSEKKSWLEIFKRKKD